MNVGVSIFRVGVLRLVKLEPSKLYPLKLRNVIFFKNACLQRAMRKKQFVNNKCPIGLFIGDREDEVS